MSITIYKTNKYYNWYYSIIDKAKSETRIKSKTEYFENHHIIPRSLGGINKKENLVLLYPREHFICHLLLVKFTTGNAKKKMMFALSFFTTRNLYSRQHDIATKYNILSKIGKNNPMYGTVPWNKGLPCSEETKKKISKSNNGKIITDEHKNKISKSLTGRKKPIDFGKKLSDRISGEGHWTFSGYFHTPEGKFSSYTEAQKIIKGPVGRWCKNCDKIIHISSYSQNTYLQSLGIDVVGKTYRNIGFYFEEI